MRYRYLGVLIAVALAACAPAPTPVSTLTAALPITSTVDMSYDPAPDTVVLNADMQPIPGWPANLVSCLYETVPRLRIWGDGLLFLDVSEYGASGPPLWTGHLSPAQIQDILAYIGEQGFLDNWTPPPADGPNPAGTSIDLGVHLKSGSIEHGSGNLDWPFYSALVKRLLPKLTPLSLRPDTDTRIASLNIGSRECSTAAVIVPPDYSATVSVLETQQPPTRLEHFVGICECVPSNVIQTVLVVQNSWQRQIGSEWVLVESGTDKMEPDVGLVGLTRNLIDWTFYGTPTRAGSVRIIAEQDNRLTLQSTQSATFYFDVPSRQFAESLSEVIPTPPLPTAYPMLPTPSPLPSPSPAYP